MNILLTKPLAAYLKENPETDVPIGENPNFNWLGHLIEQDGQKYAIFINQPSLFTIIVKAEPETQIVADLKDQLSEHLKSLQMDSKAVKAYLKDFSEVNFYRLKDKKLLGKMNAITARVRVEIKKIAGISAPIRFATTEVNSARGKKGKGCQCPTCLLMKMFELNSGQRG